MDTQSFIFQAKLERAKNLLAQLTDITNGINVSSFTHFVEHAAGFGINKFSLPQILHDSKSPDEQKFDPNAKNVSKK